MSSDFHKTLFLREEHPPRIPIQSLNSKAIGTIIKSHSKTSILNCSNAPHHKTTFLSHLTTSNDF